MNPCLCLQRYILPPTLIQKVSYNLKTNPSFSSETFMSASHLNFISIQNFFFSLPAMNKTRLYPSRVTRLSNLLCLRVLLLPSRHNPIIQSSWAAAAAQQQQHQAPPVLLTRNGVRPASSVTAYARTERFICELWLWRTSRFTFGNSSKRQAQPGASTASGSLSCPLLRLLLQAPPPSTATRV